MIMSGIPFETVDWNTVETEHHKGTTGTALWKVRRFGDIRVRLVEYSANYKADHWCEKGHILYCVDGELKTELEDGRVFALRKGMSYQVQDTGYPHRSFSENGATLFIVD